MQYQSVLPIKRALRHLFVVILVGQRIRRLLSDEETELYAARGRKQQTMTLTATEFLRRFFLHALPKGFMRSHHFGFLANRFRVPELKLCRQLLTSDSLPAAPDHAPPEDTSIYHCPYCGSVTVVMQTFTAEQLPSRCSYFDSS